MDVRKATLQQQFEIKNPSAFLSSFLHWHVKRFLSKRIALKVDVLQDRKIYCSQARLCIFSSEILQAGAVKGLKTNVKFLSAAVEVRA